MISTMLCKFQLCFGRANLKRVKENKKLEYKMKLKWISLNSEIASVLFSFLFCSLNLFIYSLFQRITCIVHDLVFLVNI